MFEFPRNGAKHTLVEHLLLTGAAFSISETTTPQSLGVRGTPWNMRKVGPPELFAHTGTSLRRVTFEISGHFWGSAASTG